MENTSKALLIAAAVLIVILLITLGIRIFSSTSNSQKAAEDTGKSISEETGLAISAITGESVSSQTGKQYDPIYEVEKSNTESREGKEVTYKGISYIILYDNGDTVQMVTNQAMGSFALGYNDNKTIGSNYFEKAVNSYNNAISRLNEYCKSLYEARDTNIIDVRSVGSNPMNKNSENTTLYTDDNLASWSCKYDGTPVTVNGIGKSSDTNYTQDIEQMKKLGIANCEEFYWLASRLIEYSSVFQSFDFTIQGMNKKGEIDSCRLFNARRNGEIGAYSFYRKVRPVVTINASAIF